MTKAQIASMIDHTLLKAAATPQQITELCETAKALLYKHYGNGKLVDIYLV